MRIDAVYMYGSSSLPLFTLNFLQSVLHARNLLLGIVQRRVDVEGRWEEGDRELTCTRPGVHCFIYRVEVVRRFYLYALEAPGRPRCGRVHGLAQIISPSLYAQK